MEQGGQHLTKEDAPLKPFFFSVSEWRSESYAVGTGQSERKISFTIIEKIFPFLLEEERRRPGGMKRMLCWLCPYTPPPCWHEVEDISFRHVRQHERIEITLKLREHDHG
jgi:hypothetical protein